MAKRLDNSEEHEEGPQSKRRRLEDEAAALPSTRTFSTLVVAPLCPPNPQTIRVLLTEHIIYIYNLIYSSQFYDDRITWRLQSRLSFCVVFDESRRARICVALEYDLLISWE